VLFKDGYWKLADFGLASEATSHRLVTTSAQSGKNSYRAPEILVSEKGVFNNKADIWAFGCIVFEIFSGGKRAFQHDFEVYQ
jgi:serine/threonine protein kinase